MTENAIYTSFFEDQRLALFEYLGEGAFRPLGPLPKFLSMVLGEGAAAATPLRLGDRMPFLENFLFDADEFWNTHSGGRAESGAWIERDSEGVEHAFEAYAMWLAGRRVLLLQNPQQRYDERVQVLQTARDGLLEHEKLLREIQKKEILLHCIVHDLSQPLTAIRGSLSLLKLQSMAPEFKEVLEIADRQSEKQETMIRSILEAFSAELAAQKVAESEPGNAPDLALCAQKTVEAFNTAFRERGAQIALSPGLDLAQTWRVRGEESRLLRIFGNLVENALRHAPAGSTVTLGVESEQNFLTGFVDDEGPGLPEDATAQRLFALFAKGKGERAGKAGLGLYFCKMTVERWGGSIGCQNRPTIGARFWFRLPRIATIAAQAGDAVNPTSPRIGQRQPATESPRPSLRILLADDSQEIREVVAQMLRGRGHKVELAVDGKQALEIYQEQEFDLALMDADMPEITGIEATKAIREHEKATGRHMRIVAMSAYATEAERTRCLESGMDSCILKPFKADDLFKIVEDPSSGPAEPGAFIGVSSAAAQPWQATVLAKVGGKPKVLASLIRVFLSDCPKKLSKVRRAIDKRDGKALASAAHALRGPVVLIFGETEAAQSTRELEAMGRKGEMSDAAVACDRLEQQLAHLCKELEQFRRAQAL